MLANAQSERREAAGAGVWFVPELDGCLPSAPLCLILPSKPFGFFSIIWAKSGGECYQHSPQYYKSTGAMSAHQ